MQTKFHASLVPVIAIHLPEHVESLLPNKEFFLFFWKQTTNGKQMDKWINLKINARKYCQSEWYFFQFHLKLTRFTPVK